MVEVPAQVRPDGTAASLRRLVAARPDEIAALVAQLSGVVTDEDGLQEVLVRVVSLTHDLVPAADAVGITVSAGSRPVTAASTDPWTLAVDRDQYAAGEGPCLEAMRTGTVQRVDVGDAALRWPGFAHAAARDGVAGFLAAPLPGPDGAPGALNLYSRTAGAFDRVDEDLVRLLAARAGDLVSAYVRYADASRLAAQLEEAMRSRATIEQAKGVLMALHGIDEAAAFDLLRRESQRRNVKLRAVARTVLTQAGAVGEV